MDSKDIFDGITEIRDDLVDAEIRANRVDAAKEPVKKKKQWLKRAAGAVAAMLAVVIAAGFFLRPGVELTAYAVAEAEYPEMAKYPGGALEFDRDAYDAWSDDIRARRQIELEGIELLEKFFAQSSQIFLTGEAEANCVYSPLNVYMALSMLANITGGESCEQILSLLGSESIDALRSQAGAVWNSCYRNDGAQTVIPASSLWMNKNVKFNRDTVNTLAEEFYASSYQGEMGSADFSKALRAWINEQTGGLLEDQTKSIEMDGQTVLALVTTLYFNAKWDSEFAEENTTTKVFHSQSGDVETDFMHQRIVQNYYWGDKFAAVSQQFVDGGEMWFLLPDEGVTAAALLSDEEAVDFLFTADKYEWKNSKYLFVNKSVPKFDVSSQFDLCEGLRKMGITDVFDPTKSDFTPMIDDTDMPVSISEIKHAARVTIDEEGCTAAAFTEMLLDGAAMPPDDEVDFILDRPFIFCVTADNGLPLFAGVVNTPTAK